MVRISICRPLDAPFTGRYINYTKPLMVGIFSKGGNVFEN